MRINQSQPNNVTCHAEGLRHLFSWPRSDNKPETNSQKPATRFYPRIFVAQPLAAAKPHHTKDPAEYESF